MNDHDIEMLNDAKGEGFSNCCGASVYGDICADCKEHCDVEFEEDEELPPEVINEKYEHGKN